MYKLIVSVFALSLISSTSLFPANRYIRSGASGNGSSWSNAYGSLPASLVRGDTYYIADGNYSGYTFDDAASGSKLITIKKATAADHGTETGWQAGYGDGQAVFRSGLGFKSDHWVLDGNTPIGTYGFKLQCDASSGIYLVYMGKSSEQRKFLTVKGLEIDASSRSADGIGFAGSGSDKHFYNCRLHKIPNDGFALTGSNTIIEYCHIDIRGDSQGKHADAIALQSQHSGTLIIRHNIIDWSGQQIWLDGTGSATYSGGDIYGNLFLNSVTLDPPASNVGVKSHSNASVGALRIYNNTFAGIAGAHSETGTGASQIRNNIYIDVATPSFGSATHSHNWFHFALHTSGETTAQRGGIGGTNPFVNYSGNDLHLSGATDAGYSLPAPYNTDRDGKVRGADGVWDRGAFEYSSTGVSWQFAVGRRQALPNLINNYQLPIANCQFLNILGQPVQQIEKTGMYLVRNNNTWDRVIIVK